MKYVKSTSQKAYTIKGRVIPRCITPKNELLELDDSEWFEISQQPVIKSLVASGDILVLNEDPNLREDTGAKDQIAALKARVTELEAAQDKKASDVDWEQKFRELQKEALEKINALNEQLAAERKAHETITDEQQADEEETETAEEEAKSSRRRK